MTTRWICLVALAVGAVAPCIYAEAEPAADEIAGWSAGQWAELGRSQIERVADEVERDEVATNVLFALCQVDGQHDRVRDLAEETVTRIRAREAADPMDADYLLTNVVYAYARIGADADARRLIGLISDPLEQVSGRLQMGWGLAERGERQATVALVEEARVALEAFDEFESVWYLADLPQLLVLVGETQAAERLIAAIRDPEAKASAVLWLGDLEIDLGRAEAARERLNQARGLLLFTPDAGMWQAGSVASLMARLGDIQDAEAMLPLLEDPYDKIHAMGDLARAYHAAGDADKTVATIESMRRTVAAVEPEEDFTEPIDIAYLWSELAVACRDTQQFNQLAEVWREAGTPLNRGIIAAGIATEMAWMRWIEQRPDALPDQAAPAVP